MATSNEIPTVAQTDETAPGNIVAATIAALALGVMAAVFLCSQYSARSSRAACALRIISEPQGVQVFMDGKFVATTPATVEQVARGQHLFRFEKHGYEPLRESIAVTGRDQTIRQTLSLIAKAGLEVTSEPPGASVLIDGQYAGRTPLSLQNLTPGEHNVVVEKSGTDPWQESVVLRQDETKKISCELKSRMESVLTKQAKDRPDDVLAQTQLAHHYIIEHKFDEAGKVLAHALKLVAGLYRKDTKVRWVREEISKAYMVEFEYGDKEAVAKCRDMLETTLIAECKARPSHEMARKLLFKLVKEAGRWTRLAKAFGPEGIPLDKSDPIAVAGYAEALVHANKADEALTLLLPAYRRHKRCWQLTYALALTYKQQGERIKAKIKFKQALLHCSDPNGQEMIRAALGKK